MKAVWSLFVLLVLVVTGCEWPEDDPPKPPVVEVFRGKIVESEVSEEPIIEALPKPRLAVLSFENKSGAHYEVTQQGTVIQLATPGSPVGPGLPRTVVADVIGEGMRAELEHALGETAAFELFDYETFRLLGTPEDNMDADFFVRGEVTSFMRGEFGTAGAVGRNLTRTFAAPRSLDPTLGPGNVFVSMFADRAFGIGVDKAHMSMVVRIVRGGSGREKFTVLRTIRVQASPLDLEGAFAGDFGRTLVDWGAQYQTPIGKAIRACLIKAADQVATEVWAAWRREWHRRPHRAATETQEPEPAVWPEAGADLAKVLVKAEMVTIRERRDSNSPEVGSVQIGTELEKTGESRDWTKVKFGSEEGWVSTADIEPAPASEPEMIIVRERPDQEGRKVGSFRKGRKVEIIEVSDRWIKIKYGPVRGWVLAAEINDASSKEMESPIKE